MRWGIVGPGSIAADFATAMGAVDDGRIVAVAFALVGAGERVRRHVRHRGALRRRCRARRGPRGRRRLRGDTAITARAGCDHGARRRQARAL